MKTLKRFVAIILALMFVYPASSSIADEKSGHDQVLEYILFGDEHYRMSHEEVRNAIEVIEFAAQLAIDQFAGNSSTYLLFLQRGGRSNSEKKYFIKNLPQSISEIDITADASTHRNYTHVGWFCEELTDFADIDMKKNPEWKSRWKARKYMLMGAVDAVFDFGRPISGINLGIDFGFDKRCENLSALIYYIHVLEDFIHDDYTKTLRNGHKIPFASSDSSTRTLLSEILYHSRILFVHPDQKHADFDGMERELNELSNRAIQFIGPDGSVSEQDYDNYHACAVELKEILYNRLRNLLLKEKFWRDVFGVGGN